MRGRILAGSSALFVAMFALGTTPAAACDWWWGWGGCDRGCGYGYYGAPAYAYYAPPAYYAIPQVYGPPVYYSPPLYGPGNYRPYAGGNYGGPRYAATAPYYGAPRNYVTAGYDDPRRSYAGAAYYNGRVATAGAVRNPSRGARNQPDRRPLPTDRQAHPTGSLKLVQDLVHPGLGPAERRP